MRIIIIIMSIRKKASPVKESKKVYSKPHISILNDSKRAGTVRKKLVESNNKLKICITGSHLHRMYPTHIFTQQVVLGKPA